MPLHSASPHALSPLSLPLCCQTLVFVASSHVLSLTDTHAHMRARAHTHTQIQTHLCSHHFLGTLHWLTIIFCRLSPNRNYNHYLPNLTLTLTLSPTRVFTLKYYALCTHTHTHSLFYLLFCHCFKSQRHLCLIRSATCVGDITHSFP